MNNNRIKNKRNIKRFIPPFMRKKTFAYSMLTVNILFITWVIVTETGLADELFLPGPLKIWQSFIEVSTEGYQGNTLFVHVFTSVNRILAAFIMACIVGIPMGVLMGASKIARALLNPLIEFYRPLPPLGLYTLLVMWLGIGEESKLALLFLAALPGLIIATIQVVQNIDPVYLRVAKGLFASKKTIMFNVYLPAACPTIIAGMRISLGFTYTVLVAAEIVAASAGIGWMIWDAAKFLLSDVVIMGLIVLGLTGIGLDIFMRFIGRILMPWTRYLGP